MSAKTAVEREWITVEELRNMLGIGRTKAYGLLADGEIPALKVGRALRVRRADVEAWAAVNRHRPLAS